MFAITTLTVLSTLLLTCAAPVPTDDVNETRPTGSRQAPSPTTTGLDIGSQSLDQWATPDDITNLSTFSIQSDIIGQSNLEILAGSPQDTTADQGFAAAGQSSWSFPANSLRVNYLKGSYGATKQAAPKGGAEFYARPVDVGRARNVTLEYQVYFPADFDFVKGGKLPGLYGGGAKCTSTHE